MNQVKEFITKRTNKQEKGLSSTGNPYQQMNDDLEEDKNILDPIFD